MVSEEEHIIRRTIKKLVLNDKFPLLIHIPRGRIREILKVYTLVLPNIELSPSRVIERRKEVTEIYGIPINENIVLLLHYSFGGSVENPINSLEIEALIPSLKKTRARKGLPFRWIYGAIPIYKIKVSLPVYAMLDPKYVKRIGIDIVKEMKKEYPELIKEVVLSPNPSPKAIEKFLKALDDVVLKILTKKKNILSYVIASKAEYVHKEVLNSEEIAKLLREFRKRWREYIEEVKKKAKSL